MAKKKTRAKKPRKSAEASETRCPAVSPDQAKSGRVVCYRVERVQRNGQKGFITAFFSRATKHPAGFSAVGACKRTMDPFQAAIRPQMAADRVGWECAKKSAEKK